MRTHVHTKYDHLHINSNEFRGLIFSVHLKKQCWVISTGGRPLINPRCGVLSVLIQRCQEIVSDIVFNFLRFAFLLAIVCLRHQCVGPRKILSVFVLVLAKVFKV